MLRCGHAAAHSTSRAACAAPARTRSYERIAHDLNDVVVRRIFAAGLDLQAALALIGSHCAGSRIHDAVGQLDQLVMDIRDTVFGLGDARAI
jgi:signal transduction histidine kinase